MTFNHGVRSSTLRWITRKKQVFGLAFLFCKVNKIIRLYEKYGFIFYMCYNVGILF